MIKLIAIDLDGTLLDSNKTVSKENKEMIKKAKAEGIKVVLCTGRPLKSVLPLLEELDLRDEGDYSITLNGGLIQKNDTGERLSETLMNGLDVQSIYPEVSALGLTLDVVTMEVVYRVVPTDLNHPSVYHTLNKVLTFDEKELGLFTEDVTFNKLVCSDKDPSYLTEQLTRLPKELFNEYNIVRSGEFLFEFVDKEVSKAAGMKHLGEILGIEASEMMSLGDEENDLPMIKYAGLGVAMANASDLIKQHADVVTKSNDEHGVAYAIEKYALTK